MSFFTYSTTGNIESAEVDGFEQMYCKFSYSYGPDWASISGLEEGITQISQVGTSSTNTNTTFATSNRISVWNFPLELALKSTNAFGWPQLVISVYGMDMFGRDVICGYGSLRLPRCTGRFTEYIPLFTPVATSPLNGFLSWLAGRLPEFLDAKFVAEGEGREVTRVRSNGAVKVNIDVTIKDFERFGYCNKSSSTNSSLSSI